MKARATGTRRAGWSWAVDTDVELSIAPFETGMGVQLWKSYVDTVDISLISIGSAGGPDSGDPWLSAIYPG